METREPALTSMLKSQMRYNAQRQSVLAQNIANIDTPGYKAKDVKKPDFSKMADQAASRLGLVTTSAKHIEGTLRGGGFKVGADSKTLEISPTDNNVTIEDQMAKVSSTGIDFQMSTNMLKKYMQMYRLAVKSQ